MKRLLLVTSAIVALGAAGVIAAETAKPDGPRDRHMRLLQYDANKDGSVSRAEIDAGIAERFKTADKDANGSLSEEEFKAYHEARAAEHRAAREASGDTTRDRHPHMRGEGAFKRVDWNLDGAVSEEEFAQRTRMMASRIDRDGDGTITAEEREKVGHHRHRHRDKQPESQPGQSDNN